MAVEVFVRIQIVLSDYSYEIFLIEWSLLIYSMKSSIYIYIEK